MKIDACHRQAQHCTNRLEKAKDPRVRQHLRRERDDWIELAETAAMSLARLVRFSDRTGDDKQRGFRQYVLE